MAEEQIAVVGQTKGVGVIGYSITANIDGNRQMVFQHFVPQDATDDQVNADLDRIMRLIDRQRSVYELPELREELHKLSEEIAQYNEDMVTQAEVNFGKAQAELHVQLETLQKDHKKVFDEAYAAFRNNGRQGQFEPKGQTKANLERLDAGIRQITEQLGKNAAERDFFQKNTQANIERRLARIDMLKAKIAEREGLT